MATKDGLPHQSGKSPSPVGTSTSQPTIIQIQSFPLYTDWRIIPSNRVFAFNKPITNCGAGQGGSTRHRQMLILKVSAANPTVEEINDIVVKLIGSERQRITIGPFVGGHAAMPTMLPKTGVSQ